MLLRPGRTCTFKHASGLPDMQGSPCGGGGGGGGAQ